jgi:hypothetical protein
MGMQLELYFNTSKLKQLLSTSPHTVLITCETVPNPNTDSPEPVLLVLASSYASDGSPQRVILGCPTPCRPTGSVTCQQQAENLLTQLEQQFASSLL